MGTLDELRATLGEDFFTQPSRTSAENRVSWQPLCVCGHLTKYHSPTVGGEYVLPTTHSPANRAASYTTVVVFNGCKGPIALRNFETETIDTDHETMVTTQTLVPTCPCDEFREVAKVDRPNRFFNQRLPDDRKDANRHPFLIGLRAFSKHLAKRKAAQTDAEWATAEFDRRFEWTARICGISKCRETDGVLPTFVTDDRSELRCPKHR
jgi:hypothetical protein